MSRCHTTKPGIERSTSLARDQSDRSSRELLSGRATRSCPGLVAALHPSPRVRTYQILASRSRSMISDGETASWVRSLKASVAGVHCLAFAVDMIMILLELSATTL